MACTEEMAKMQFAQSAAIRESYKNEEYDSKHSDIRQWLDVMNEVNEAFQKTPDSGCSYRQKILFDCMHSSMYLASDNLSLDNMLDLVMQLASAMDCACERERDIVDYRSAISMLFKRWFEIRESVTCGLIRSEINKWQSSKNNRNKSNDVKRMVLGKIVSFLLDDSADFLEETVSEYELENEEIDLDFTIVLKSLLEAKSMFRKRYIGFRQYGLMEVCDGRICFEHDEEELFMIMKAHKTRSFIKAYYSMKLYVEYLQKMANVSVSEWCIPKVEPEASARLYKTYADLTPEMQSWVLNKEIFDDYVVAINERIAPRIAELNNKQYWDVVLFVSQVKGALNKLSRAKFAILLVTICEDYRDVEPDTIDFCMKKCNITTNKNPQDYYKYRIDTELRKYGDELLKLF